MTHRRRISRSLLYISHIKLFLLSALAVLHYHSSASLLLEEGTCSLNMSLDDRCQQFHEAALGTGKSKGAVKEVTTLRKFLHKNQSQRFTDKGVNRLFDTIQLYVNKDDVDKEIKEGLLEDSLKMPFTVFSTKQKKIMINWLEDLRGTQQRSTSAGDNNDKQDTYILSVIELENGILTLMYDDTGDTFENIPLPKGEMGDAIRKGFEDSESCVAVQATIQGDSVLQILGLAEGED
jgi:Eukaryotic elongation factor 5A hypusine, DNA-binding OB fold